jgi:hypothetical protein
MRGIKLNFNAGGPTFDFTAPAIDFGCTVQNALVNVGTDQGSDPFFTDRGTNLKKDGARGLMVNSAWATHSANFAALRTLSFIQQTELQSNPFKLQSFILRCQQVANQSVALEVQATSTDGTIVGIIAET